MIPLLKKTIQQTLARFGYRISRIPAVEPDPQIVGSTRERLYIFCNFCGTLFRRIGGFHSEFLECPVCGTIARERVVFHCILLEINRRFGKSPLFINETEELRDLRLLECSPRFNQNRKAILSTTLREYISSDFDMSGHPADIQLDLTDARSCAPYLNSMDIIICAHVLEHIPDFRQALENLNAMLAPGGMLVLQVPILQNGYEPAPEGEFHADNTRVYHHFGFDLLRDLDDYFTGVQAVVGLLEFQISSTEIRPNKYQFLEKNRERCILFGDHTVRLFGLGIPDLCEAFIGYKKQQDTLRH